MKMEEKNLKIILLNCPEDFEDFFNYKFLSLGKEVHNFKLSSSIKDFNTIINYHENLKFSFNFFIIAYLENLENKWLEFLIEIRKNYLRSNYNFIILTNKINTIFLQVMLLLNAKKILLVNEFSKNKIFQISINQIKISYTFSIQKANIIYPDEKDILNYYLTIPNTNYIITAIVHSISINEAHLEILNFKDLQLLLDYKEIPNAEFIINSQIGITNIKIIEIKETNSIIRCKFYNSSVRFLNLLSRYIMKNLSTTYLSFYNNYTNTHTVANAKENSSLGTTNITQ